MRGCLFSLVILAIVGFVLIWVALPAGAGMLALSAMRSSGLTGTNLNVTATADPPFRLLVGQADTLRLVGDDVSIHDLDAGQVDITFRGVALFEQRVETVHGTFAEVLVATPGGDPVTAEEVTLDGDSDAAKAVIALSADQVRALAEARLLAEVGLSGRVTLTAPDRVRIESVGQAVTGRLVVTKGALLLRSDSAIVPTITLIDPRQGNPFQLQSIVVTPAGGARLTGTVDIQALLKGQSVAP